MRGREPHQGKCSGRQPGTQGDTGARPWRALPTLHRAPKTHLEGTLVCRPPRAYRPQRRAAARPRSNLSTGLSGSRGHAVHTQPPWPPGPCRAPQTLSPGSLARTDPGGHLPSEPGPGMERSRCEAPTPLQAGGEPESRVHPERAFACKEGLPEGSKGRQ